MNNCLNCKYYREYTSPIMGDYTNSTEIRCSCVFTTLSTAKKDFKPYCCATYSPKAKFTPALKPCPFCGSYNVYPQSRKTGDIKLVWNECLDCHARSGAYNTEVEANIAWNVRDGE